MRHPRIGAPCCATVFALTLVSSSFAHVGVLAPNGGETLPCGTSFVVTWKVEIPHEHNGYDVEYSTSGPGGPWKSIVTDLPPGDLSQDSVHTYSWTVPEDLADQARVRVTMKASNASWNDVSDGDFSIANTVSIDLGFGKIGGNGKAPQLSACGDLGPSGTATLALADAPPATGAVLFIGTSDNPTPFFGGTLVPVPVLTTVSLFTDSSGAIDLPVPGGVGPASFVLQYALADPGATHGVGLSNAVRLTWP